MHDKKVRRNKDAINPIKIDDNLVNAEVSNDNGLEILNMQKEMGNVFTFLGYDNKNFKPEIVFKLLFQYIKRYERILYSTISNIVYMLINGDDLGTRGLTPDNFGTLISNIEKLIEYINDDRNIATHKQAASREDGKYIDDTKKAVWKIWDHVNLAHRQYRVLKQTDGEYDVKFETRIEKFQNKITREMNAQLLTIVGIFTALSFILFGGISSAQNILLALKETSLLKLMIIVFCWTLGMLDIMFVFFFCIAKMNMADFKVSVSCSSFWQRYPVFCWVNFILISLISTLSWIYFCSVNNSILWLSSVTYAYPKITTISGLVLICACIIFFAYFLAKRTYIHTECDNK